MSTVPKYPVPFDPDDRRFDDSFVDVVGDFLHFRGFPWPEGADYDRLREVLRGFLFGQDYGHDRIDHGDPAAELPADVEGHAETGRDRVTGVPLCEHGDDAAACQLKHSSERPECGAWCAAGLCTKDRGHDGDHGEGGQR